MEGEEAEVEHQQHHHLPAKGWSVLRTYEAFDGLHAALLRRFYGGQVCIIACVSVWRWEGE